MTMRSVLIQEGVFDLAEQYQQLRNHCGSTAGAIASFVGLVRDHNAYAGDGGEVASLTLEHYPGMTEASIDNVISSAEEKWPLLGTTVIHRVGALGPADQIVLVLAASAHREAAFAAAHFIMDLLKTQAVFWKKETSSLGERWIESMAEDHDKAQFWEDGPASVNEK